MWRSDRPSLRCLALASLAALACSAWAATPAPQPPRIERAWFGPADRSHGHDALGTGRYPGRVDALVRDGGREHQVSAELPPGEAFEDARVRLADLDGDGGPEIVLVTASRQAGGAIAVWGVERRGATPVLVERARSPAVGAGRWLNPVGMADFDGDGRPEVVAVLTPHIGGVLTLYRYRPPHLVPVAQERDVSNHVYGALEQQLAAVVVRHGRPAVAIPDQSRRRLRFLAPAPGGGWTPVAPDAAFDHPIEHVQVVAGDRLQVRAGGRRWLLGAAGDMQPIGRSFEIDRTEVTIGDFRRFVAATGTVTQAEKAGGGSTYEGGWQQRPGWTWHAPFGTRGADAEPAVHITYLEAEAYCRWAGKRLPTDEEWGLAAYVELRTAPPAGFQPNRRYPYPTGESP